MGWYVQIVTWAVVVSLILGCALGSPAAITNNNKFESNILPQRGPSLVKLTASPSTLQRSGQNVSISWSGVSNPSADDFVALYISSAQNDSDHIGWKSVTNAKGWQSGSGILNFQLINMRTSFEFRFWEVKGSSKKVIARSNVVDFVDNNEPLQGHLALTKQPNQMRVMWVSANASQPCVLFGTSPHNLNHRTCGQSISYSLSQLCTAPANLPENFMAPGSIHNVLLDSLALDTTYYYRYGDGSTIGDFSQLMMSSDVMGWSDLRSFRTSPGVGPDLGIDFIAYGDLGVAPPWNIDQEIQLPSGKTVKWVLRDFKEGEDNGRKPSLVLHIGDISYARGYSYLWELFFHQIQEISTQAPYMVCIGNHEYDYIGQPWKPDWSNYHSDSGGECGVPYNSRFYMPGQTDVSRNLWYSFDYGNVHFVFMSSEHDFLVGSEQWKFLDSDLKNVDRSRTPWVIFSGHRPMYTSSDLGSEVPFNEHLRNNIEPLLLKYGVNLCLWGHVHQYERTCGISGNFTCAESDNDAPVHLVIGMAGNSWQVSWGNHGTGENYQPDWSIFRSMNWGYTRLWTNSTHLHFQYLGDQRGEVHDELWLVQK